MEAIEIKKMSTNERLQTMEAIWNSLLSDNLEIKSPEWHEEILNERKSKIEKGIAEFLSISEVKNLNAKKRNEHY